METQNNKNLLTIIGSLVIGVALVFLLYPYFISSLNNYKKGSETGSNSAKNIVEKSTVGELSKSTDKIINIFGTITAIKGNVLTVHTKEIGNSSDGSAINDRNITVGTSTKIDEIKQKTPEVYKTELAEFTKKNYTGEEAKKLYPELFTRIAIEISALKVGDQIMTLSSVDIKDVKNFLAKEIHLVPSTIKVKP